MKRIAGRNEAWKLESQTRKRNSRVNTSNVPNRIRHKINHFQLLTKAIPSCTAPQAKTTNVSQFWGPTLRSARFPGSWLIKDLISRVQLQSRRHVQKYIWNKEKTDYEVITAPFVEMLQYQVSPYPLCSWRFLTRLGPIPAVYAAPRLTRSIIAKEYNKDTNGTTRKSTRRLVQALSQSIAEKRWAFSRASHSLGLKLGIVFGKPERSFLTISILSNLSNKGWGNRSPGLYT